MSGFVVSVVIPTRDRAIAVGWTLDALDRQRGAPPFEVIVVDDGSRDDTIARVRSRRAPYPLRVVSQPPGGPARARNAGVAVSAGDWIAFLGSDTLPAGDWLRRLHEALRRHRDGSVAVIGRTEWHSDVRRSRFLDFVNEFGLQFGYRLIADADDVPFNFFYGSNVALHRRWLEQHRFDERFLDAAWEDVELGLRLTRSGLRIVYRPEARAFHRHEMDISAFLQRQRRVGASALVFRALHPALAGFLQLPPEGPPAPPSPRLVRAVERTVLALEHRPVHLEWAWKYVSRAHYLDGSAVAWSAASAVSDLPVATSAPALGPRW